jgi:hypothetical protein
MRHLGDADFLALTHHIGATTNRDTPLFYTMRHLGDADFLALTHQIGGTSNRDTPLFRTFSSELLLQICGSSIPT